MKKAKNKNKNRFDSIKVAVCILFLSSCDNMIKNIDVEPAHFSPRLAVSATINTDGGVFSITFAEARSIGSYRDWREETQTIIRKGSISLYEDERLLFREESERFDMSLNSARSGYSTGAKGLEFKAGASCKLVVEIDGYPTASAITIIPEAPIIEHISADMQQFVKKNNPYKVEPRGHSGHFYGEITMSPLTIRIKDNSSQRNYYMVQRSDRQDVYPDGSPMGGLTFIGISNTALIQDNPDMESAQSFLEGEETDVYLFDRILLSDMSFPNTTGTLDLWVANTSYKKPCETPAGYLFLYILVSHLSAATFEHYRSLALQSNGTGFFSEPVSIAGNIENGYGCFAAINTVRTTVAKQEFCEGIYY